MTGEGVGLLCRIGGWTYGVLWCIDRKDPRLLAWEESYYEEKSGSTFERMIKQVHVIGQGAIGEVASSGQHRWINFHVQSRGISVIKDYIAWQHLIMAGIKTVAIISLPGLGVIQFGSVQKICESPAFIAQARLFFRQLGLKQIQYGHVNWKSDHPEAAFPSAISFSDSSNLSKIIVHDSLQSERKENSSPIYPQSLGSEIASVGSQIGTVPQTCSLNPHASSTPLVSTSSGSFNDDLIHGSSTSSIASHERAIQTAARVVQPVNNEGLHPIFKGQNSSVSTIFKPNIRAAEIEPLSSMEKNPFTRLHMPGVLNMNQTSSHSSIPSSETALTQGRFDTGKFLEFQHISSPPVSVCSISTAMSSFKHPQGLSTEKSAFSHTTKMIESTHDKPLNNHILSREQRDDRFNTEFACGTTTALHGSLSLDRSRNPSKSFSCAPTQLVSDNDMFDGMEVDLSPMISMQEGWDDITFPVDCTDFSTVLSDWLPEFEIDSVSCVSKELFSDSSIDQPVDVVLPANCNGSSGCNSGVSFTNSIENTTSHIQTPTLSFPERSTENTACQSPMNAQRKPLDQPWIDDSCSVNVKGSDTRMVRKRSRPGESTRPRPRDRQQIQDRVKELRLIVPNGAKCSIDALLERTISHMIYLQNVIKYVEKLKQADGPKIVDKENGVVLKDSNTNPDLDGATWAYQMAGQSMVCPISVDDLRATTGQMLVEMVCEEQGLFMEIVDVVRGFGLTILKGVMELCGRKIWARFLVEASRDISRMDVFQSLVHLAQQTCNSLSCEPHDKAIDGEIASLTSNQQSASGIQIGLLGCS